MTDHNFDIAIIGMSCRFPGADDLSSFWKNLQTGTESIKTLTNEQLKNSGVPEELIKNPHYVKASPVISNPEYFDASFFGYTPLEAKLMDPQHRILLECAWNAIEDAAYDPEKFDGRIGVFAGSALNTYFMNKTLRSKFSDEYIPTLINNDKDFLSTKLSYKMNLKGPSINVQTACSTSLVAVHLGCQSLISNESDMIIAGAVSVKVPHEAGYIADGGGIVSRDGHVRAFDSKANGTVFGSGCGVVILKRLNDAVKDGDNIYAVIKGSAVNNDGSEKAGYTAPGVNSQAEVITEALTLADVDAETISYIETHGSGTPIGDPIEFAAMTKAFRNFTGKSGFCAIGSVKTNIGHLDAAAGMAGLIKTVLSLKNRTIAPSINFTEPNPEINFADSPFYVNTKLKSWNKGTRRAGVISTGMGGTNACLILEEAPEPARIIRNDLPALMLLSAKNEKSLDEISTNLAAFLKEDNVISLHSSAYSLQARKEFSYRRIFVARNKEDAAAVLEQKNSKRIFSSKVNNLKRPVVFLMPGIGDHYIGMGYDLYKNVKAFSYEVDKCADILNEYLDTDIRQILYPEDYINNRSSSGSGIDLKKMLASRVNKSDPATMRLNQTKYVQPVLFTIEYALAKLWMHLGIIPAAIAGHSLGEYTAACLSGVISLEDALWLVAVRAKMVNELPLGSMIAVTLPEKELTPLLPPGLSISLINGPELCVLAGLEKDIKDFSESLTARKILFREVQNAHAFHSRMMDPIRDDYLAELRKIKFNKPLIPYTSNLTGSWITEAEQITPEYWAKHSSLTARFSDALEKVWQIKNSILVEIGPGNTLSVLAMQHPESRKAAEPLTITSLRPQYDNQSDINYFLNNVGKLWLSGRDINWDNLYDTNKPQRVSLPVYSFQRERFWIDPQPEYESTIVKSNGTIHKNPDIGSWYYIPYWKRMLPYQAQLIRNKKSTWLIFTDDAGISAGIIQRLQNEEQNVVIVSTGKEYSYLGAQKYSVNPADYESCFKLIKDLSHKEFFPDNIIHAWNISQDKESFGIEYFRQKQKTGFYSLIYLTKALSSNNVLRDINLFVLSNNMQDVLGSEYIIPEKSTASGPVMVISQEHQNIKTKSIDIDLNDLKDGSYRFIDHLLGEVTNKGQDTFSAIRTGFRWVLSYEQVKISKELKAFRKRGVYLITGGLGEVSNIFTEYLAQYYSAKLILVNRTVLPSGFAREEWLNTHDSKDPVSRKLEHIKKCESFGAEVIYFNANVDDEPAMRNVISSIYERFGKLDGVIHGAGIVGEKGFSSIKDIDIPKCETHFQAKADGVYVLQKVLKGKKIDFCMLMSSLTPILGGLRESGYSASNIFMDNFSRKYALSEPIPWISVNWDLWRINEDTRDKRIGKTLAELGISPVEGLECLETVLSLKNTPQIVISTGDLNARINQWVKLESLNNEVSEEELNSSKPEDISTKLTGIWEEVLGVKKIKAEDNFFELGGHSLLAIQLISAIRRTFRIDFGLDDIFSALTLSEMVSKVSEIISGAEV